MDKSPSNDAKPFSKYVNHYNDMLSSFVLIMLILIVTIFIRRAEEIK